MKNRKQKRMIDQRRHHNRAIRIRKNHWSYDDMDEVTIGMLRKTKVFCSCALCRTRTMYGDTIGQRRGRERALQQMRESDLPIQKLK